MLLVVFSCNRFFVCHLVSHKAYDGRLLTMDGEVEGLS
jgi:hypothetical protein